MSKTEFPYLHGFDTTEQNRLRKQAEFTEHTVYKDINLSQVKKLIEVGSGVGAQTEILLRRFPKINIDCIDLSTNQLEAAEQSLAKCAYAKDRYTLHHMNATDMEFETASFDGAFLCWILEHVPDPGKVLSEVRRVLRPGSVIYITEVLNSSFFLEPYSPNVWKYWMAFNDYQYDMKGDPFIGAKLGNILMQQGYRDIKVTTKTWHLDNRRPGKRKEFIEFWTDLLLSASDQLVKDKYVDEETVKKATEELKTVRNDPNAVFYYSFIQAKAKAF
ncbi:class I SAM-dependent methyltransferase [Bacteriovorax sp. Seq25_V]|uniref:class I SAM-dependent methyltransferase n=1 Tax=Bacteriovorax sp. Seq25_V TaxID=1201288 RepID=UPI00038A1FE3|nr:class I SAM-dependent methyltransferase [Bacteriovorax sp. Seq25_V]EQC47712.1 AdoMet dependent proline di-methyltransferase [Bacteriovorax sp. Seq25_V]